MLHRVLASLLCLLGAAALTLGIASATAWRADDVLVADAVAPEGTTMIVTAPGVLDLAADEVTVTATVPRGDVVIALGRTADVEAWVGTDAHLVVTGLAEWHTLAADAVAETTPEPEPTDESTEPPAEAPADPPADATEEPAATEGAPVTEDTEVAAGTEGETSEATDEATEEPEVAPDPSGSDLWVAEEVGSREASMEWTRVDGRWSVLVAATEPGVRPTVALAWPQVVTTPWLVPGAVGGSLLLLIGLAWWVFILVGGRRRRRAAQDAAARPEPTAGAPATRPGVPVGGLVTPAPAPGSAPSPSLVTSAPSSVAAAAGDVPMTRRRLRELEEERQRAEAASRFPTRISGPQRGRRDAGAADEPAAKGARGGGRRFGRRAPEPTPPVDEPVASPFAPVADPPPEQRATPAASADAWRRAWGLGSAPLSSTDQSHDEQTDGGTR